MDFSLVTLAPTRIACLRHVGPYGAPVARFWQEIFVPWMLAHDLGGRDCYGIGHDDPRVSDPAQCRYDASVAVPEHFVPEGPVSITTLPGGCYAQWRYWGDGPGIARAWQTLRRDWLPQSGLRIDNRPCFEWMPAGSDYDPKTGEFACLICIPVQSE